ncbi:MAG: glycine rich domain-containing protein, partial [Bacteroidota bacterium]|nr:glycine rich domain-containing protein [Bacteroidota bacterium]
MKKLLLVLLCLPLINFSQTTFNYTGSMQTYTVPSGITLLTIEVWGAQGGSGVGFDGVPATGGLGGYSVGDLVVTPGQVLEIYVGGEGDMYGSGGFNGGGMAGTDYGAAGGGASDVRIAPYTLYDRVIVAGGGGGGAFGSYGSPGGYGGGLNGGNGTNNSGDTGGGGGTQTGGGSAGCCYGNASPGTFGYGGGPGDYHNAGGGGGWYGGGSGAAQAGAGGGSGYVGGVTNTNMIDNNNSSDGLVVITEGTSDYGCTDPAACNYSASALYDDGSCLYGTTGCTDPTAVNYDPAAVCNSACVYCSNNSSSVLVVDVPQGPATGTGTITVPANATSVTLDLRAGGDLDSWGSEYFDVYINGSLWQSQLSTGYQDCSLWDVLLNEDVTSLLQAGTTNTIEVTTSNQVDDFACSNPARGMTSEFSFSFELSCHGCMDSIACNYDPTALIDTGGICLYGTSGCTDPIALNYDPNATCDDESCFITVPGIPCDAILTGSNSNAVFMIQGNGSNISINTIGSNYDTYLILYDSLGNYVSHNDNYYGAQSLINYTLGQGTYYVLLTSCCNYFLTLSDYLNAGLSNDPGAFYQIQFENVGIQGCMDPTANNYDSTAVCDDGSCCYVTPFTLDIYTDNWCGNAYYMGWEVTDPSGATIASGGSQAGETYTDYTNYSYDICVSDPCGVYNLILYDQSGNGWNYCSSGASATLTDVNGNVVVSTMANCCWSQESYPFSASTQGCTDPVANNYDANAVCDDGSCCYTTPWTLDIWTDGWCGNADYMGWTIEDDNGTVIASGGSQGGENYYDYTTYNYDICITDTCSVYNLILYDQSGNGWNYCSSGASATLTDPNGNVVITTSANCCWSQQSYPFSTSVEGCTDPTANNYDPNAVCDDGSCCYGGTGFTLDVYTGSQCGSASRMGWTIEDNNGTVIASGGNQNAESWNDNTNYSYDICITDSCQTYNLVLYDDYGSSWNYCGGYPTATLTDASGNVVVSYNAQNQCCWSQEYFPFSSSVEGCTDPAANNYDANALCDNGLCCYTSTFTLDIFTADWCGNAYNMGWEVQDANGTVVAHGGSNAGESYTDNTNYSYDICITDTCGIYDLILYDNSGNGWNYCSSNASATLTDPNGNVVVTALANCCWSQKSYPFSPSVQGCTDPAANNYDASAVCDDGSCCYASTFTLDVYTGSQCNNASRMGWTVEDANGTVIASGGNQNGESWSDNTNYSYTICITDTCQTYNLVLYDDYGNSWNYCGGYPTATLTDPSGNVVVNYNAQNQCCWSQEYFPFISSVEGCTDPAANNYDANALCDDGTCCYGGTAFTLDVYTGDQCGNASRMGWTIEDNNGTVIASGGNQNGESWSDYTNYSYDICITDTCQTYNLWLYDDYGNSWNYCGGSPTATLTDHAGNVVVYYNADNQCCWSSESFSFISSLEGCTDPTAFNYDPTAFCDDGTCCYGPGGCIDPVACNYDPTASCDDGSCSYASYTDVVIVDVPQGPSTGTASIMVPGNMGTATLDLRAGGDLDSGSETFDVSINGVQWQSGLNTGQQDCNLWDVLLNENVTSLLQPGVVNTIEVTTTSSVDDFACSSPPRGMTSEFTFTFNNSCYGCMDTLACNYDADAVVDSGCVYGTTYGCTDPLACNYDWTACYDDGSCILPDGCTDPTASNYDANALCDDGSCCVANLNLDIYTDSWCGNAYYMGWIIKDGSGATIASGGSQAGEYYTDYTTYNYDICITDSCDVYELVLYDQSGNGWNYCSSG